MDSVANELTVVEIDGQIETDMSRMDLLGVSVSRVVSKRWGNHIVAHSLELLNG